MIGQTLGENYVLDECVGEGAMGRVYRAHHARLERRRFAVKVLLGDLAADPSMRQRFSQEAQAASRLEHPNVVSVLDFGQSEGGLLYIVMEFIDGDTLADRIARGPIPEDITVKLVRQLCLGLAHAHDQGLVHRDFKPDNVAIVKRDAGEEPRILDFGLAIISDPNEASVRLTRAGLVVGTPAYSSPEQAQAKAELDLRTDLFSLGVTMYEMLSGRLPFDGGVMDVMLANISQDPPPIAERAPGVEVTPALEDVVRKLMGRSLEQRYQTAREVIKALDSYKLGVAETTISTPAVAAVTESKIPPSSEPEPEPAPSRGRGLAVVIAIVIAAALGAGAYALVANRDDEPASEAEPIAVTTPDAMPAVEPPPALPPDAAPAVAPDPEPQPDPDPGPGPKANPKPKPKPKPPEPRPEPEAQPTPDAAPPEPEPEPEPEPDKPAPEPEPDKPAPKPKPRGPLDATATITKFNARGSLPDRVVRRAVQRVRPELRACYQEAAKQADRNAAARVTVTFQVDETGRARSVKVGRAPLPGLSQCIETQIARVRTRVAPDVGSVRVKFVLQYQPVKR